MGVGHHAERDRRRGHARKTSRVDDVHGTESVGYIVMESGEYTLADGTRIEADRVETDGGGTSDVVTFGEAFNNVPVVLSAVFERQSWRIESDEGGTVTAMHGRSHAAFIKGIYNFLNSKNEKSPWNLSLAAGYEQLVNRGTPGVVAQGDIDQRSG